MGAYDTRKIIGFEHAEFARYRVEQCTNMSCWSACVEIVFRRYNRSWLQLDHHHMGIGDINYAGSLDQVEAALRSIPRSANNPMGWPPEVTRVRSNEPQSLIAALERRVPVILELPGNPGHGVVAYRVDGSVPKGAVWVCDPAPRREQPWSFPLTRLHELVGAMLILDSGFSAQAL